jgi:hypothetical protein
MNQKYSFDFEDMFDSLEKIAPVTELLEAWGRVDSDGFPWEAKGDFRLIFSGAAKILREGCDKVSFGLSEIRNYISEIEAAKEEAPAHEA